MRRETSTVVVLAGPTDEELLADLASSPNVTVARAADPATRAGDAASGWEPGARAMQAAARLRSTYVIVPDDPLAAVAEDWRQMWDLSAGDDAAAEFERHAAEALTAWRNKRFDLPDYYLVLTPAVPDGAGPDLYLGPLRSVRPRRVAVAVTEAADDLAGGHGVASRVVQALRTLEHGPWWPPLDELLDTARRFYPGALAGGLVARSPHVPPLAG